MQIFCCTNAIKGWVARDHRSCITPFTLKQKLGCNTRHPCLQITYKHGNTYFEGSYLVSLALLPVFVWFPYLCDCRPRSDVFLIISTSIVYLPCFLCWFVCLFLFVPVQFSLVIRWSFLTCLFKYTFLWFVLESVNYLDFCMPARKPCKPSEFNEISSLLFICLHLGPDKQSETWNKMQSHITVQCFVDPFIPLWLLTS